MNFKKIGRGFFNRFGLHVIKSRHEEFSRSLYDCDTRPISPRYVNLGAGSFFHPYWHNVDMPNDFYAKDQLNLHIVHDFTKFESFQIESDSVEVFYTSHVIEHLPNEAIEHLFSEVHRCLVPGGLFRVTCPDMGLQYKAYSCRDGAFWMQPSPWGTVTDSLEIRFLEHFATILCDKKYGIDADGFKEVFQSSKSLEEFFTYFYKMIPKDANSNFPEGHCNWFTKDKVVNLMKNVGFSSVYDSGYLQSMNAKLRDACLFDSTCPELSLYVESVKS